MKVKQLSTFSLYSSFLLSVAHPVYADPPLSRPYPCTDPRIITSYDSNNPNYHYYDHSNVICNKTQGGCNSENVFNTMISQMRFIAPTTSSVPVRHCRETTLPIKNPIKTTINDKSYSITNYTLPGHMLYPGKIVRRVEETSNAIVVRTIGTGIGGYKEFNLKAAPQIWGSADRQLSREIERKSVLASAGAIVSGCQATIDSVKAELVNKRFFVPYKDALPGIDARPKVKFDRTMIRKFWFDYPDDRTDSVVFLLGEVAGLWRSQKYMTCISSKIIKSCNTVGLVSFAWMLEGAAIFGYFPGGEIKEFKPPTQPADYRQMVTSEGDIGQYRWGFHESP